MSINNVEKHATVLEGIEMVSHYLVWGKIAEANLTIPFEAHDQLEVIFVQLYTTILAFAARSLRHLRNKSRAYIPIRCYKNCTNSRPDRVATAFFTSESRFRDDVEQMSRQKQSIESYAQQIACQTHQKQYREVIRANDQLQDLQQPVIRMELAIRLISAAVDRTEVQEILDWASAIPFQKPLRLAQKKALAGTGTWLFQDPDFAAWHNCSRSQMLWLHGNAGSGKSILL